MARIENIDDFKNITSKITSFSHAYLFDVNSLEHALPYIKEFAKQIFFGKDYEKDEFLDMNYQIDNEIFDDLYIVNPNTIGINTEEISKLLLYMETKSLRPNGKRVYIIYGFERLSQDVSNKILKFLEEPEDNIYALLMTENYEKILPTIISRCQVLKLFFPTHNIDEDIINKMKKFLAQLTVEKKNMIAYEYDFFGEYMKDRIIFINIFDSLETIISETINKLSNYKCDELFVCNELLEYPINILINILDITNKLKCLIKNNINLNLLIDRYIIEVAEELSLCKK